MLGMIMLGGRNGTVPHTIRPSGSAPAEYTHDSTSIRANGQTSLRSICSET